MLQIDITAEQLFLLSAFAPVGPARNSPLLRLSRQVPRTMTGASQRTSIADLSERGLVAEDVEGRPILSDPLHPVFVALHRPERVLRVVRSGPLAAESWLCRRGEAWVRSDLGSSEGIESLAWPLACDDITTWFADQLLADLAQRSSTDGPTKPLAEVSLTDETHTHRTVRGTAFTDRWTLSPGPTGHVRPLQLPAHSPLPSVFSNLLALLD